MHNEMAKNASDLQPARLMIDAEGGIHVVELSVKEDDRSIGEFVATVYAD